MLRLIKEFLKPSLKCARVGHAEPLLERRQGYMAPSKGYRGVADSVVQERVVCRRCREPQVEWLETERTTIHSLTLNSDKFRVLDREGEVWLERRYGAR